MLSLPHISFKTDVLRNEIIASINHKSYHNELTFVFDLHLNCTDKTSGHGTHSNPEVWGSYLKALLELTDKK